MWWQSLQPLLEHLGDVLEVVVAEADVDDVVLELGAFIYRTISLLQL